MPDVWDEMDEAASRAEREIRREQAAAEMEAHQLHLASRSLTYLVWEAMQQGDRVENVVARWQHRRRAGGSSG